MKYGKIRLEKVLLGPKKKKIRRWKKNELIPDMEIIECKHQYDRIWIARIRTFYQINVCDK